MDFSSFTVSQFREYFKNKSAKECEKIKPSIEKNQEFIVKNNEITSPFSIQGEVINIKNKI